jgi:Tol biopolymer transport system component
VTGGPSVYSARLDGTGLQLQAGNAKSPTVSPDGRWLAYRRQPGSGRIQLKNLRTGAERQLPSGVAGELDFSPDGERLVYVGRRLCNAAGSGRQALLTIGPRDRHPSMLLNTCGRRFIPFSPAWAPRGDRVALTRAEDLGSRPSNIRMGMVTVGGTLIPGAPQHQRRTFEGSPSWQPLR